jgi:hypothetical protein
MVAGLVLVRRAPSQLLLDPLRVVPTIDIRKQGVLGFFPCPPTVRYTSSVLSVEKKFSINALS